MRTELLTIGSELTNGATLNTNAVELARRLAEIGLVVSRQVTVADTRQEIAWALRDGLRRSALIITTGGLGPTFDDITTSTIAEVTGRPLEFYPEVAGTIRRFYTRRRRRLQRAALRQAYLPRGAVALPNPIGTAPGLWLRLAGRLIVALPGVPREMHAMLERIVLPRLRPLTERQVIESFTLRSVGIVELQIERALRRLRMPPSIQAGLYPDLRAVDVRLTASGTSRRAVRIRLSRFAGRLTRALGPVVYGSGRETLEGVVGRLLTRHASTLAVAESCTGGLVSHRLTNIPGSSRYLRGSIIAYHNDLKRTALGVPPALLHRHGAVSAAVARAMARGVRRSAGSDVGLSITGVAGPGGGTARKPVGLTFIGLSDARTSRSLRCRFLGDRSAIKFQAAQTALDWLRLALLDVTPPGARRRARHSGARRRRARSGRA